MNLPNRIPELEQHLVSSDKTVYYLQKIFKYDDGYTETCILGVWDSPEGDIDKVAQNFIRQEKEFCEYNKFVKPHTFTIRKIRADVHSEVVESKSEHYGSLNKPKTLKCSSCGSNIHYGDSLISKHYDTCDRYFCCTGCLAEFEDAVEYSPKDSTDYNKLFNV